MSNNYYNTPAVPIDYTLARAEQIKQQFAAIAGGFDKLPLPEDLLENRLGFVVAGGTADALTADMPILDYEDGMTLKVAIASTNTGPATMNVNGLGVIPIVGRLTNPLGLGDLVAGTVETMVYYDGKFIIREVSGAQGPQGEEGPPGPLDGATIQHGTGAPTAGIGNENDFYIRTSNWTIYGPKVGTAWGSPTSIIGPKGDTGLKGDKGDTGDQGLKGDTGDQGLKGDQGDQGIAGTGGSWNDLADRPEHLTDFAALTGVAGALVQFTGANSMAAVQLDDLIGALDAGAKNDIAGALGAIRIESMSLAANGYIRFALPADQFGILQWGTQVFAANATTTVDYPCPTDYTTFSIAVVSSARQINNAQDNCAQTVSCGLSSFVAYSANDNALPGFWLAWGV